MTPGMRSNSAFPRMGGRESTTIIEFAPNGAEACLKPCSASCPPHEYHISAAVSVRAHRAHGPAKDDQRSLGRPCLRLWVRIPLAQISSYAMRLRVLTLVATLPVLPTLLFAQQSAPKPYQFTIEDYARAERMLGPTVLPLVSGTAGPTTWLPGDRFWYRATTAAGATFFLVDPAKRTRAPAFDHAALALALGHAADTTVKGDSLPFNAFALSADGSGVTLDFRDRRWTCDRAGKGCTGKAAPKLPPHSRVSPDSSTAVFIRHNNLWAVNLASGVETQLTPGGVQDFGYATNNAGWVHSDDPVVTWSPDSRRIATFQHDGRGVRDMVLAGTNPGAPTLQQWKYPLPGDSVIFRIQRVIID